MGLMPVMSKWVQENTSILPSKTCRNCSFSSSDKRKLTYVCLPGPPRSIDYRGSIIVPCLPSLPGQRTVISILGTVTLWPDCWGFQLSHTPVPTADSISELLTSGSGGQSVRHRLGN